MTSGTIFKSGAEQLGDLWRDHWASSWHVPLNWSNERLRCFLSATEARQIRKGRYQDPMVADLPKGRRPFLGVLTQTGTPAPSVDSGILQYNEDGHLLTVAPTRSGKGVSQIVPNLLLYGGSSLVIDIKGENYAATHEQRARMFPEARIYRFAPLSDDTAMYNPMDFVRAGPRGEMLDETFEDARLLAEMLLSSQVKEDFWEIEARSLLTMMIIYIATTFRPGHSKRNMRSVVQNLFAVEGGEMAFDKVLQRISDFAYQRSNEVLISLATQFADHEAKVKSGILSTCRSGTSLWLSPRLQRATEASDFQFSELKASMCRPVDENPAPTTLYIIIPPEYLDVYRPVLRMLVGLAAVEMTRPHAWATEENLASGWRRDPPCPVLFLLDEFPALGYMRPIEQGVAYLAGYGVQIWTFVQNLGQLKEIYKENWNTFIANAGAACYFSMSDPDLCEYLHKQLGNTAEYELRYTTTSEATGTNWGSSSGSSTSYGNDTTRGSNDGSSDGGSETTTRTENARFKQDPVATSSDIRAMPSELQLVFWRNQRPILATLLPYFKSELFRSLYGEWQR